MIVIGLATPDKSIDLSHGNRIVAFDRAGYEESENRRAEKEI